MKRFFIALTAIVLSSAALLPTQAVAQINLGIVIGNAPPPVRYEAIPVARRGYEWAPGYWDWNGRQHIWAGGHWERARPGYYYQRPEWRQGQGGWQLQRGRWQGGAPQHGNSGHGRGQHEKQHGGPDHHGGPDRGGHGDDHGRH